MRELFDLLWENDITMGKRETQKEIDKHALYGWLFTFNSYMGKWIGCHRSQDPFTLVNPVTGVRSKVITGDTHAEVLDTIKKMLKDGTADEYRRKG